MDAVESEKEQLRKLAQTSGKPLEIQAAAAIERALRYVPPSVSHTLSLGSYFVDAATEKHRELDVLVEIPFPWVHNGLEIEQTSYLLCSCKGFPENVQPITYSMPTSEGPDYSAPSFPCSKESLLAHQPDMGEIVASKFLSGEYFRRTKRILGFDTVHTEHGGKPNQQHLKLSRKGDRDLFLDGWDSAVKASLYWADLPSVKSHYARLLVPILVLPKAWWDFPLKDGKVREPEECSFGHTTTLYPIQGRKARPRLLTTIIVSLDGLEELIGSLKYLLCNFGEQLRFVVAREFGASKP